MTLKERIERGLEGKYQGLDNGFNRINNYIFGLQRATYYLIGGQSGTFKTTLVDFMLLNAIQDAEKQGIPINVFYFSFEIDELTKKCNWLSSLIYKKYGVLIPTEKIKGLGHYRLTIEEQELVNQEIPTIEEMFSKINWLFKPENPTGLYKRIWKFMENRGTFKEAPYTDNNGVRKMQKVAWTPNNPDEYNIMVLDHLALTEKERGFETKANIDKYSEYCVSLRNMFGMTAINVSQFNDGLSSVDRAKFKGVDLSPQMTDFKDTRNPYADADIVLGTMAPYKLDMTTCMGYKVDKLQKHLIMLKVIKNRLSSDNIAIGIFVNPKAMTFKELPKPTDDANMTKVYKFIEELNKV